MKNEHKVRTPLVHLVKRDKIEWWKAWLIRLGAIGFAVVFCAMIAKLVVGVKPVDLYQTMIDSLMGNDTYQEKHTIIQNRKFWDALQETAILLCIALAVTPAFKMRFWNIGAEGQVLMGCLASAGCMLKIADSVSPNQLLLIMFFASAVAGAIWGLIPAFFKSRWNTNETLFTLMLNYVATQIVAYFCIEWAPSNGSNVIGVINRSLKTPDGERYGWLPSIFEEHFEHIEKAQVPNYAPVILTVLTVTLLMYVYLKYSKQGYELSVVGESENTARYIGINVKKVVLRTMLISGAICGIAGFLLVSGIEHTIATDTVAGRGFTAIMVSWLAKFNPIVMIATSFLFVFMDIGASKVATDLKINESFSDVLTAIIIFFIIGCEFFINYKIVFNSSKNANRIGTKNITKNKADITLNYNVIVNVLSVVSVLFSVLMLFSPALKLALVIVGFAISATAYYITYNKSTKDLLPKFAMSASIIAIIFGLYSLM